MVAKETKNDGIIKKKSKMALRVLFENKNSFLSLFALFAFYLTYQCVRSYLPDPVVK